MKTLIITSGTALTQPDLFQAMSDLEVIWNAVDPEPANLYQQEYNRLSSFLLLIRNTLRD